MVQLCTKIILKRENCVSMFVTFAHGLSLQVKTFVLSSLIYSIGHCSIIVRLILLSKDK